MKNRGTESGVYCTLLIIGGPMYGNARNSTPRCLGDFPDDVNRQTSRIINGMIANRGEIPYQVSLRHRGAHHCGGTIYDKNVVITAAHCVAKDTNPSQYLAVAGEFELDKTEDTDQERAVCRIHIHPKYTAQVHGNDVAVLVVCAPFQFTSYVQPIGSINMDFSTSLTGVLQVSGWGRTVQNGSRSLYLRKVSLKPYGGDKCRVHFCTSYWFNKKLMLCAGGDAEDACQGDSGGPLVLLPYDPADVADVSKHKLVGIVSWGVGCGHVGIPGVYTNVATYHEYIEKNAGATTAATFTLRKKYVLMILILLRVEYVMSQFD